MHAPFSSAKIFASPMRYCQGPGILNDSGRILKGFGDSPFVFGSSRTIGIMQRHGFFDSLSEEGLESIRESFRGECCDEEIERLRRQAHEKQCGIIVGVGGGKALDTAKAVGSELDLPVICVPTIASTDAPTSSLSAIYTSKHEFKEYKFYSKSPTAVIVDTKVIAEAPARYLACGIGDAFSKKFEVKACYKSHNRNQVVLPIEGFSPITAAYLADITYEVLTKWGKEAMYSAKQGEPSVALEAVVEACILLSGLSFESGGLAAAHSIYDGFTVLEQEMSIPQYHGELVFFGTCIQLGLEGRDVSVFQDVFRFGHEIGLPISLEEIGLAKASDEDLWRVSEKAVSKGETIHKMPIEITAEAVFNAIKTVDSAGKRFCVKVPREPY